MSGTFNYLWKPNIPGKYVVTAAFAGDESYGISRAETAVDVVESPSASPTTAPANLDAVNNTVVTTVIARVIAIIIAIAIIGLVILKKNQSMNFMTFLIFISNIQHLTLSFNY